MPSRAFRGEKLQYKNSHSHKKISVWLSIFVLSSLLFSIPSAAAAEGDLDTSFGGDGIVTTPTGIGLTYQFATSIALQSDGKIVAAGYSEIPGNLYDFAIVRFNENGTLDTSFSGDGMVTTDLGASYDAASSIVLQSDGKIVVAGSSDKFGSYDFVVVRYNADGTLDTTFDTDGIVTTNIGNVASEVSSIALQSDGKIVVAGNLNPSGNSDFAVVRYNANGTLDTTFDTDGIVTTNIGNVASEVSSIALQSDGKIVVAGNLNPSGNSDFAVVRYNANGTLDTTFDTDGIVTTDFGASYDAASSIVLQSDGKIVVAGRSEKSGNSDFAVVRYNANGTPDTTFDTDGIVTTKIGNWTSGAYDMAIQGDGKIVAAGYSSISGNFDFDFAVVRYLASNSAISQSITFPAVSDAVVGSTNTSANATASSGNNVVYRSNTNSVCTIFEGYWNIPGPRPITLLTVGTCSITAMEEGDATYAPAADVTRTFNVTAAVGNNAAAEAARLAAAAEAAKKAKEQKELTELLSVIPSIAGVALNLGDLTNSLLTTNCVKGKTVKSVKKGAKCPKGYVKKK